MMPEEPTPKDLEWQRRYEALKAYARTNGVSLVSGKTTYVFRGVEYRIGAWVSYMRAKYRQGRLNPEWVTLLEQLPGWSWERLTPGPRPDKNRDAEILELRAEGVTLQAIAEKYNISRQRVHQIVNRKK